MDCSDIDNTLKQYEMIVNMFVDSIFKEFKNYPFPEKKGGYATCYDRLFSEVSEDEIKKYIKGMICDGKKVWKYHNEIERIAEMGSERLWLCMYHDLLGSGKFGC